MAVRTDIQYVQYYVDGSAARKLEKNTQKKHAAAPKSRKAKRKVVVIDPVAILGVLVAVCMLVFLVVGFVQHRALQQQTEEMSLYIDQLQQENAQLEQTYQDGYDLDEIRDIAQAMGMIPAGDAPQIEMEVQIPQEESTDEMTIWESFTTFLAGLFA